MLAKSVTHSGRDTHPASCEHVPDGLKQIVAQAVRQRSDQKACPNSEVTDLAYVTLEIRWGVVSLVHLFLQAPPRIRHALIKTNIPFDPFHPLLKQDPLPNRSSKNVITQDIRVRRTDTAPEM